jgi:hypothetical protein
MTLAEREQRSASIRDRDGRFTRSFDDVFRFECVRVIWTTVCAPRAKARGERWVRKV